MPLSHDSKMNSPSEWMKIFDPRTGWYRYMHKGTGVIRDELMGDCPEVAKPAVVKPPKEAAPPNKEERGAKKIRQLLGKGGVQRGDAMWKLVQILANRL